MTWLPYALATSSQITGQLPLRLLHTNFNRKEYAIVNVETLNRFEDGATVNAAALIEAGVINKELSGLKVLGNGELTKKLTVEAVKFSKSAKEAIEKAGGKVEVL